MTYVSVGGSHGWRHMATSRPHKAGSGLLFYF
jgi:hypothetical protein